MRFVPCTGYKGPKSQLRAPCYINYVLSIQFDNGFILLQRFLVVAVLGVVIIVCAVVDLFCLL